MITDFCFTSVTVKEPLLKAGEAVLVTGKVKGEDTLYVEHTSCLLRIPEELANVMVRNQSVRLFI